MHFTAPVVKIEKMVDCKNKDECEKVCNKFFASVAASKGTNHILFTTFEESEIFSQKKPYCKCINIIDKTQIFK